MARASALARARVSVAALALGLVLQAAGAADTASAAGTWGHPLAIAGPLALDVIPAQLGFAADGTAAIGFGVQDEDNPSTSDAFTTLRAPGGRVASQRRVPGQEILGLAYAGPDLELLVGTSPHGQICCRTAQVLQAPPGRRLGRPRMLVGGLAGATEGRLVPLPGRVLAAVATERGVWVAQSSSTGAFGSTRSLSPSGAVPQALDATGLPEGRTIVTWTALSSSGAPGPTSIYVAEGSLARAPGGQHVALTVPAGHVIDELAVAPGAGVPTIAWIESWFDSVGRYHSQAMAADLRGVMRPQSISTSGELASGLAFGADSRGDQALAWMACSSTGSCLARALLRPAGRRFGSARTLGSIDAAQDPSVAVAPGGEAIIGWLRAGHVLAAAAARGAGQFGPALTISSTGLAADLNLGFGPLGQALAVWTQGTLAQTLTGAVYSVR